MIIREAENEVVNIGVVFKTDGSFKIYTDEDLVIAFGESSNTDFNGTYPDFTIFYPNKKDSRYGLNIIPIPMLQHGGRVKLVKNGKELKTDTLLGSKDPNDAYKIYISSYRVASKKKEFSSNASKPEYSDEHLEAMISFVNAENNEIYKFLNDEITFDEFRNKAVTEYNALSKNEKLKYAKSGRKEIYDTKEVK